MKTELNAKLNKRERKAAALLKHYATCERLALALGMPAAKVDGKKISVALMRLEFLAHQGATAHCNGETFRAYFPGRIPEDFDFCRDEDTAERFNSRVTDQTRNILGTVPPGFFVNHDARGYALKIDPDNAEGKVLTESCRLHTDWGRNGILSPNLEECI